MQTLISKQISLIILIVTDLLISRQQREKKVKYTFSNNYLLFLERSIDSLIKQVHLNGYSEQLLWLTTYINDEANDRELDNEWEELCIVTVEQSIAEALKTDLFCDLMNTLGLTPPSEQVNIFYKVSFVRYSGNVLENSINTQPIRIKKAYCYFGFKK